MVQVLRCLCRGEAAPSHRGVFGQLRLLPHPPLSSTALQVQPRFQLASTCVPCSWSPLKAKRIDKHCCTILLGRFEGMQAIAEQQELPAGIMASPGHGCADAGSSVLLLMTCWFTMQYSLPPHYDADEHLRITWKAAAESQGIPEAMGHGQTDICLGCGEPSSLQGHTINNHMQGKRGCAPEHVPDTHGSLRPVTLRLLALLLDLLPSQAEAAK